MQFSKKPVRVQSKFYSAMLILLMASISACDSNNDNNSNLRPLAADEVTAVVATVAPDFSSGAHSLVSLSEPREVSNNLLPTDKSDIRVVSYGEHFYRIERFAADNITKFSIDSPQTPVWQFSTMDDSDAGIESSNPYDLVFVSETKAYLLRFGSSRAWVVNPSATSVAEFKIGELDLSAYADADTIPEMAAGIVVGNRLFIVMQRLSSWIPGEAYVAVFDTASDTEIATGSSNALGASGIALPIRNPLRIQHLQENSLIYIQAVGEYPGFNDAVYDGGIISLDPDTFEVRTILDDGDAETHPYGNISNAVITSADTGFFLGYQGWGDNSVYRFNPETGEVANSTYADLQNINISDLAVDPLGMVWVGNASLQGINIINPETDSVATDLINTVLNPVNISFVIKNR